MKSRVSLSVPWGGFDDSYGQLFTRFVTFGLPNPVAKSQPLVRWVRYLERGVRYREHAELFSSGRKQLLVP